MKEIEIKLRIKNENELRRAIIKIADFDREYEKNDEYYIKDDFIIRVRDDYPETYVTYKVRKVVNNTEVNDEFEMTVSSKRMFIDLLLQSGYKLYYKKQKKGYSLKSVEGINFDISSVNDLGMFLEIEKVVDEKVSTEDTIKELKEIMNFLNLNENQIETKSYAALILESDKRW